MKSVSMNRVTLLLLFPVAFLAACASLPKPPGDNGGLFRERNEGYSLLHKLMSDESQVDGILVIKHADEPLASLVKEIAAAAKAAKQQLDGFPKADNRIEFDVLDLPRLEQETRDLEAKQDTKDLLFSSGQTFELRLIFTQAQAMGYAVNLCHALMEAEDNPDHKNMLSHLADQCAGFQQRLMAMLIVKS
jgi:hypothetical protein